ncbi:MAG: hypothetical protein IRZ31_16170 [Thermogemmatispora sp.]|uniref:PhoU domain-containing protein n=1 Tax=Thermogemmatispora sp. TaxID=1968838 RepID=UPI00262CBF37|nr:PhoU domain-containing protein [Thermogemmatispora sp.]MBX5458431.1 hypothetical protein [Thermogemmatispora sp.]
MCEREVDGSRSLRELQDKLIRLAILAGERLTRALKAVEALDPELARTVLPSDPTITSLQAAIEDEVHVLFLEGEEMAESTRRFLVSLPVLGSELRLLSEEAQELARLVVWLGTSAGHAGQDDGEERQWPETIARQGEQLAGFGHQMSASAMAVALALAEQDTQGAQRLWRQQRRLQHELTRLQRSLLLMTPAGSLTSTGTNAPGQRWIAYLSALALLLKRISSHYATLCERIIFVVEGVRSMRLLQRLEARLLVDRRQEPAQ